MKVGKEESIVRMGEDAGHQHFPPFHNVSKGLFPCSKGILLINIKIVQENKTEGKR